nr:hypothetical protein [uncultured Ligilactobacillus sp.]
MNKENIVEELNEWAKKELGSEFRVETDCGDLTLFRKNEYIAWFVYFHRYHFKFNSSNDGNVNVELIKNHIIEKFHDKAIELMSEYEPKYTVQVIKGNESAYLNYSSVTKRFGFLNSETFGSVKTEFTKSEIEEFKKRDDLAIDWDKAVIKEVND